MTRREEIEKQIAKLQAELDAIPVEFPAEQREYYIGWDLKTDTIGHCFRHRREVADEWKYVSKVKLVEIERVK